MNRYYPFLVVAVFVAVAVALPGAAEAQCRDCFSFQAPDPENPEEMIWVHAMESDGDLWICDGHGGGQACHTDVWTQKCNNAHTLCLVPTADVDIDALGREDASRPEELQRIREGLANGSVLWLEDSGMLLFLSACEKSSVVAAVAPSRSLRDALGLPS